MKPATLPVTTTASAARRTTASRRTATSRYLSNVARAVLPLVYRSGRVQSFHVKKTGKRNVLPILRSDLEAEAKVITDESGLYKDLGDEYMHGFVNLGHKENGRGVIHINSIG